MCRAVLRPTLRLMRVAAIARRLRIHSLPRGMTRGALLIQMAWREFVDRRARWNEPLYALIVQDHSHSLRSPASSVMSPGGALLQTR